MTLKHTIISIISLLIIVSSVFAVDLSEFPKMFIEDNDANVILVVGKAAKAEDVLGAIDIAVMLQNEIGKVTKLDIARLDNEIDTISEQNLIIVGGPCANSVAAKLLGYPQNCLQGFEVGKGMIKLYEFQNGNVALLVAGALGVDTRRATHVLANYKDFDMNGTTRIVSKVQMKEVQVKAVVN